MYAPACTVLICSVCTLRCSMQNLVKQTYALLTHACTHGACLCSQQSNSTACLLTCYANVEYPVSQDRSAFSFLSPLLRRSTLFMCCDRCVLFSSSARPRGGEGILAYSCESVEGDALTAASVLPVLQDMYRCACFTHGCLNLA